MARVFHSLLRAGYWIVQLSITSILFIQSIIHSFIDHWLLFEESIWLTKLTSVTREEGQRRRIEEEDLGRESKPRFE